ncbi:RES domain-containing protein [Amphritea sp.]|uniref:RES domain-containing protein n=1 Tax=Amphritea sp. TaxID=1872502 RepID=UPI003D0CE96E
MSAYYRFVFLRAMEGEPPAKRLNTEHTLFTIGYSAQRGIQLQHPPFEDYTNQLTHPRDYAPSQTLGAQMREWKRFSIALPIQWSQEYAPHSILPPRLPTLSLTPPVVTV